MDTDFWRNVLIGALLFNAALGLGYRVYRLTKGGPIADVWGQAVLAAALAGLAIALAAGAGWPRWLALAFAVIYAFVAMPVWVLGVLLPMGPRALDYAFTALYWVTLLVIGVASLAI
jgi:hypothetical protein